MIKIYLSEHCSPCQEIKELLKNTPCNDCEIIDIETDEGFYRFTEDVLKHGDGALPSAYKDSKRCEILIDEEENKLLFNCPE